MPVYKFKCTECGNEFEELYLNQNNIKKQEECPECGGIANKVFTASAVSTGTGNPKWDKQISEDPEEYKEMHYHEKMGNWEKAAEAAKGESNFAKEKFEEKAKKKKNK